MSPDKPSDGAVARPKFGDRIRGNFASEKNPIRDGFYVRTVKRTGFLNPGTWYELTDGKGKFWQFEAKHTTMLGDGPDYPDGCSLDGFVGGCDRMGCHDTPRDTQAGEPCELADDLAMFATMIREAANGQGELPNIWHIDDWMTRYRSSLTRTAEREKDNG